MLGYLVYLCTASVLAAQHLTLGAVDVHGKHYSVESGSSSSRAPWFLDCIAFGRPDYPYADRARWHQGLGLFRITLDVKTGLVSEVAVIKSTGFTSLDNSAVAALRKCRWKPGRWKEIDVPVNFMMTNR